ncbi:MAG: OsmC family protein [Thermoleophilia bacterium]|nr:OsmC family protein [Thermoleophilia bacterium]
MRVEVDFPTDDRIQARCKGMVFEIGPPPVHGDDPEAPGPFDLLLSALALCTGYQVLAFLKERGLPHAGAGLGIDAVHDEETHMLKTVSLEIRVPGGFPEKYNDAIVRAAGQCAVKAQLGRAPEFEFSVMPAKQGANGRQDHA